MMIHVTSLLCKPSKHLLRTTTSFNKSSVPLFKANEEAEIRTVCRATKPAIGDMLKLSLLHLQVYFKITQQLTSLTLSSMIITMGRPRQVRNSILIKQVSRWCLKSYHSSYIGQNICSLERTVKFTEIEIFLIYKYILRRVLTHYTSQYCII